MSKLQERNRSPKLDEILGIPSPLLDKGFIRVVDYMGNDSSVVQAARVSYGAGTKSVSTDKSLINYLMRHEHNTPFEMATIKFHVKCPIFVARQWLRHRTGSFNECSARYSEVQDEFYLPSEQDIKPQSRSNHQGREDSSAQVENAPLISNRMLESASCSYSLYQDMLEQNIARELARTVLPVSQYTEFYWSVNLRNLLHFIKLRVNDHAQYEIRVYAEKLLNLIKLWVPHTADAFSNYSLQAESFSRQALSVIHKYIQDQILITQEESGMSKREYDDLMGSTIFAGRFFY